MLTSTDRAGNAQRSRFQFFIPSARHVTDHDQLDNPPTHDQPPHFGQPTQANVWSWGSVGSGGGWGTWSLSNSGGGSGGTFTPTLVGPAQPVGLPAAPQSGTAPLSGSGYEYAESIRDIVDRAVDFISVSPETATKKAALDHRESILDALGERLDTLIHHDGNFYNDRALVERLRPVMQGLFAAAYDPRDKGTYTDGSPIDRAGVEPAFADLEAGWLAQSVVRDPLSVRVQVFQATLLAVVTEATPLVTDVAQQQALAAAVMELAKTYAWLNPHPEATVPVGEQDFGFLDALWRLQIPAANGQFQDGGAIAQTLSKSVAAVGRLLAGVQEPVRAIQFLNNLVQAASNVTSLKADVKDATFLRELVEFGVEFVKTNPTVNPTATDTAVQGFLDRLWRGDTQQVKQAQGGLNAFFAGLETEAERIKGLEFAGKLIDAADLLQDEGLASQKDDPVFLDALIGLGGAYAALDPLPLAASVEDPQFFLNTIWQSEGGVGIQKGADELKLSLSNFDTLDEVTGLLQYESKLLTTSKEISLPVVQEQLFNPTYVEGIFTAGSGFMSLKFSLNQPILPSTSDAYAFTVLNAKNNLGLASAASKFESSIMLASEGANVSKFNSSEATVVLTDLQSNVQRWNWFNGCWKEILEFSSALIIAQGACSTIPNPGWLQSCAGSLVIVIATGARLLNCLKEHGDQKFGSSWHQTNSDYQELEHLLERLQRLT